MALSRIGIVSFTFPISRSITPRLLYGSVQLGSNLIALLKLVIASLSLPSSLYIIPRLLYANT